MSTPTRDNVLTALRGAEHLLERGWCQGALARDAHGDARVPRDPAATSWCVRGALFRAIADAGLPDVPTRALATHALFWATSRANLPLSSPSLTNDDPETTQADMIRLVSTAIAMVEAGEVEIPEPEEHTSWT